jgi:transposase
MENMHIWGLRTGSPWRDLLPNYGNWKTVYADFIAGAMMEDGKSHWMNGQKAPITNDL